MGVIGRAKYRIWQFWRSVRRAPLRPEDEEEINEILNTEEMMLFQRQALSDQQHALRVMRELRKSGHTWSSGQTEKALLSAALLHDVGKSNLKMAWWDRPIVVLAEAIVPARASRWAEAGGSGWSRPFLVKSKHAEWGAEAAAAVGSSALTVELIRRHSLPVDTANKINHSTEENPILGETDRLLALLRWADGIN